MPRVVLPPNVAAGTEIVLETGELARVEGRVNANTVRVRLADGSEQTISRQRADVEPKRERDDARRARVEAHRPGYRRIRVRYFDAEARRIASRIFTSDAEAAAFAEGKQLFGDACVPGEIEP